ncbi:MAG: hypothetical protein LCI03_02890 [Actinobacteria bacterium]|nr:hypothetical protein [Actinomycetota bacterium]
MRIKIALSIAAATLLAVTACGNSGGPSNASSSTTASPSPTPLSIRGWISVPISTQSAIKVSEGTATIGAKPCDPKDGYDDISDGAQVTITDESGKVIALTELRNVGLWADKPDTLIVLSDCRFDFFVDVPATADFYGIEIAHRGVVRYSKADLADVVRLKLT